mmetsp:Transcript_8173/g.14978  ORF Transcript_8173/g.14978 Transcript_8173/m.14978 type:complete len:508 (+) Transcript_8173:160-1683(+)
MARHQLICHRIPAPVPKRPHPLSTGLYEGPFPKDFPSTSFSKVIKQHIRYTLGAFAKQFASQEERPMAQRRRRGRQGADRRHSVPRRPAGPGKVPKANRRDGRAGRRRNRRFRRGWQRRWSVGKAGRAGRILGRRRRRTLGDRGIVRRTLARKVGRTCRGMIRRRLGPPLGTLEAVVARVRVFAHALTEGGVVIAVAAPGLGEGRGEAVGHRPGAVPRVGSGGDRRAHPLDELGRSDKEDVVVLVQNVLGPVLEIFSVVDQPRRVDVDPERSLVTRREVPRLEVPLKGVVRVFVRRERIERSERVATIVEHAPQRDLPKSRVGLGLVARSGRREAILSDAQIHGVRPQRGTASGRARLVVGDGGVVQETQLLEPIEGILREAQFGRAESDHLLQRNVAAQVQPGWRPQDFFHGRVSRGAVCVGGNLVLRLSQARDEVAKSVRIGFVALSYGHVPSGTDGTSVLMYDRGYPSVEIVCEGRYAARDAQHDELRREAPGDCGRGTRRCGE